MSAGSLTGVGPGRRPGWSAGVSPDQRTLALSLAIGAVAGALLILLAPALARLDFGQVLLFVGLVAVARLASVDVRERISYSVAAVPILAAGMLMGVAGAVAVAPVGSIAQGIARRSVWYKIVFNAGVHLIAGAAATGVFWLIPAGQDAPLAPGNLPALVLAALAAGGTYYLHTFLVAAAVALGRRASPLEVWRESFRWLWSHYPILGAMALLLALAYDAFGLVGVVTFVVPPIMMRQVAKQYLDRTIEHVRELRAVNARLEAEIEQRTAAEQESSRLAREAARADALEELSRLKSEFVSVASHELRTPTAAVMGFSELLLDDIPAEDPSHRMVALVHRNAEQLASLVDNLLDVSRIEVGQMTVHPTTVDLATLLPAVLAGLEEPEPRHQLTLELEPGARWAQVDPDRLRQIVTNLVSNAMKYAPGGEIRVCARPDGPDRIALTVADQGIGIPPEHLERIFDRFQRIDRSMTRGVRGTGLGLYIVRHLVELHGGTIRVESEPGRGSTFEVTLPAGQAEPGGRAGGGDA